MKNIGTSKVLYVMAAEAEYGPHLRSRFTPLICGVGPVGGKAHSPEEYLELDTIVPRAQAAALTILRLKPGG